jgi:O-antigen ligase
MLSSDGLTSSDGDISITMAHSNFIQTFLGLGIIGFILLVIFWIDALRVAYDYKNRTRETQNFLRISSLLVLFYSIVEYGVFGPPTIISPLFLTILIHSSQSYLNISTILHRSKNVSVF